MSRQIDCDPGEVVHLNGQGSMLLLSAVQIVMSSPKGWLEPVIFRKGYKRPRILNLTEIEQLAAQPGFREVPPLKR